MECGSANEVGGLGLHWAFIDAHMWFLAEDGAHVCGDCVCYCRLVCVHNREVAREEVRAVDVQGSCALVEGLGDQWGGRGGFEGLSRLLGEGLLSVGGRRSGAPYLRRGVGWWCFGGAVFGGYCCGCGWVGRGALGWGRE